MAKFTEFHKAEVRHLRITLPRTSVNKGKTKGRSFVASARIITT